MSLVHLLVLLGAAALHVVQHVAIKKARNRTAFLWWMWLYALLLFLPVIARRWKPMPPEVLPWLLMCAAFDLLYFRAIARAYDQGPLSTVYPVARGSAPPLLLFWCGLLLGEWPRPGGALGILVVVAGIALVHAPGGASWRRLAADLRAPAGRWALAAGLCISLYTFAARAAVRTVDPLQFAYLDTLLVFAALSAGWFRSESRAALRSEGARSSPAAAAAGATALASFGLALIVISRGVPAAYVGAVREVSVVLGALTGWLYLREPGAHWRLPGAVVVAAGVAMIATLG